MILTQGCNMFWDFLYMMAMDEKQVREMQPICVQSLLPKAEISVLWGIDE